jgi:hypothetical protein
MYLNLLYEHKVNNTILPNCQPKDVFDYCQQWIIDTQSDDLGLLMRALFDKFGNDLSVIMNSLGFQTLPLNDFNKKHDVGVRFLDINDVYENYDQYKNEKLFFVIEPFGHINFFVNRFDGIHPETLRKIHQLNATIVINYSHEGHLDNFFVSEILKKIIYKRILFIHNDYLNDFSEFESRNIRFLRVNYYLNRSSRYFQYNLTNNDTSEFLNYDDKEYHFLSFNQYIHHHRAKIISEVFKNDLQDKFLISFNPKFYETLGPARYDYENQLKDMGFWEEYQHVLTLPEHKVDFETTLRISGYGFEDTTPYKKSVISLISDTIFFKKSGFISEKIFKPIMYLQPFLIVGPPHYLKEIRNMGFKTFNGLIDERYDDEEDDMKRLTMIIDEIKRISSIPIEELKIKLKDIENILIYNQIKLLTYDYELGEIESCKKIVNEGIKCNLL